MSDQLPHPSLLEEPRMRRFRTLPLENVEGRFIGHLGVNQPTGEVLLLSPSGRPSQPGTKAHLERALAVDALIEWLEKTREAVASTEEVPA